MKRVATVIVLVVVAIVMLATRWANTYTREGRVVEKQGTVISVEDYTGNVWMWEEEEDENYKEGDRVVLTMDDNNTEDVVDDVIKSIKTK